MNADLPVIDNKFKLVFVSLVVTFFLVKALNRPAISSFNDGGTNPGGQKAVPFIFLSTWAHPAILEKAYKSAIQGFFQKNANYNQFKDEIRSIIDYWQKCIHPNSLPAKKTQDLNS